MELFFFLAGCSGFGCLGTSYGVNSVVAAAVVVPGILMIIGAVCYFKKKKCSCYLTGNSASDSVVEGGTVVSFPYSLSVCGTRSIIGSCLTNYRMVRSLNPIPVGRSNGALTKSQIP